MYGTILASAVVVALGYKGGSALVMLAALAVTELVFALAHAWSALLAAGAARGGLPSFRDARGAVVHEWPVVQATWPAVIALALAALGAYSTNTAVNVALVANAAVLFVWGVALARLQNLSLALSIGAGAFSCALGAALVALKLACTEARNLPGRPGPMPWCAGTLAAEAGGDPATHRRRANQEAHHAVLPHQPSHARGRRRHHCRVRRRGRRHRGARLARRAPGRPWSSPRSAGSRSRSRTSPRRASAGTASASATSSSSPPRSGGTGPSAGTSQATITVSDPHPLKGDKAHGVVSAVYHLADGDIYSRGPCGSTTRARARERSPAAPAPTPAPAARSSPGTSATSSTSCPSGHWRTPSASGMIA